MSIHPQKTPSEEVTQCRDPVLSRQSPVPGPASALHPAEKPGWAQRGQRGSGGGSHSLNSRHVWGGHGADFFGFLKSVLLVKGLLFLLLVLWRKEGRCLVGCRGFKGRRSHQRQQGMRGATSDTNMCGRTREQAPLFPESTSILLLGRNFSTAPGLSEGVSAP